jgi:hypothetical protein
VEDVLLRCLAEGYEFLRTPRGLQLLSWALVIACFVLIWRLANQSVEKLNKSIKEANAQEETKNPRGAYPTTTEGQIKQYERLLPVKLERDANLKTSIWRFAIAMIALPTVMLISVVYFNSILSLGQPGLQLVSSCSCGPNIADPTISQTLQFVLSSILGNVIADWISPLFGQTDVAVQLKPYSLLALFLTAYKLAIPTVAGGYIAKYLELSAAFGAISPRLRRLQNDLRAAGVLPSSEPRHSMWSTSDVASKPASIV